MGKEEEIQDGASIESQKEAPNPRMSQLERAQIEEEKFRANTMARMVREKATQANTRLEETAHPRSFRQKLFEGARTFVADFINNALHR